MFQINKILRENDLNPFLWFIFPILITLIFFIVKFLNINLFITYFIGEKGIIENGTFLFLFFAIITAFSVLNKLKKKINLKTLFFFIIFFLIGLIYFTGEEISWGQQWFKWETSSFFKHFNNQSETNFHNISSWFDQKPRFILLLFIFFGGIFIPFYLKIKKKKLYSRSVQFWLFPNICCIPSAIICLFFYILDNIYKFVCFGTPGIDIKCNYIPYIFVLRTSEIIELFVSLFLFIYVLSIYARLKNI